MNLKQKITLSAVFIVCAAMLSIELVIPLNGDNEIYQSMASDLFRFHRLPYLGSWDQNFPGIVYIHWTAIAIFGDSSSAFRLLDVLVHLAMSGMFYLLLRTWLPRPTALLSVLLYNAFYFANIVSIGGERETYITTLIVAGTLFLFRAGETNRFSNLLCGLSGLAFGAMISIRPTTGLYALCAILYTARFYKKAILVFVFGMLIPILLVFIPYAIILGGLEQVYLSTVRYNLEIYGIKRMPWSELGSQVLRQKFFFVPAIAGIMLTSRQLIDNHRSSRSKQWLVIGYGLSGIISLLVMGKYWTYSFEPLILLLVPFAAIAFDRAWNTQNVVLKYGFIVVVLCYFFMRVIPISDIPVAAVFNPEYEFQIEPGFTERSDEIVARYLENAPRNERFEVASIHAGLRWKCRRESSSRFTTFYSITEAAPDGSHPDFQRQWQREYIDSLRSIRPFYIAISHVEPLRWPAPVETIHTIPGFDSEILPNYSVDTVLKGYTILRRRS
jgi:hypothetical protein